MKRAILTAITAALLSTSAVSADTNRLDIGGNYLGGFTWATETDNNRFQFDFAVNLDFEYELADDLTGIAQLQASPGSSFLGFPGPQPVLTDVSIVYTGYKNTELTMGSFDAPFGQKTAHLTNNADTFNNPLIINDLFYSAFGGTVGTLNTLGVMGRHTTDYGSVALAITNGTDESAANPDYGLGYVIQGQTGRLWEGLSLGAAYMDSNDQPNGGSGFGADFDGWMIDAVVTPQEDTSLSFYFTQVRYGDTIATTQDQVNAWGAEIAHTIDQWVFSGRVSGWNPENRDANGAGISGAIPNPGLAAGSPVTDQSVTRYELGLGLKVQENVLVKSELFVDDYQKPTAGKSTDTTGVLLVVNGKF